MPDIPPTVTPDNAEDAKRFLDDVIMKVARDVSPEILQAGEAVLLGLAVIVICWAGLRTAFEGFNSWTWIQALTTIMIPWSILAFYDTPLPGTNFTFPESIAGVGSWAMNVFMKDAIQVGPRKISEFGSKVYQIIQHSWDQMHWSDLIFGTVKVLLTPIVIGSSILFIFILFCALWVIVTAQVLWGHNRHRGYDHARTSFHSVLDFRTTRFPFLGLAQNLNHLFPLRRRRRSHPESLYGPGLRLYGGSARPERSIRQCCK